MKINACFLGLRRPKNKGMGMEWLLLAVFAIGLWIWMSGSKKNENGSAGSNQSQTDQWLAENMEWLDAARESIADQDLPGWYSDPVTDRQLEKIKSLGIRLSGPKLSKGDASDIIGFFYDPDGSNLEILKFFKIPIKGLNETRARYKVRQLLADPENREAWENRPPTSIQKEFFRFVEVAMPKGMTSSRAEQFIREFEDDEKLDLWCEYEDLWDELSDRDTREEYEIKKPSMAKFREAWKKTIGDSEVAPSIDEIIDALLEIDPSLNRD
jgi:hypothetical protein